MRYSWLASSVSKASISARASSFDISCQWMDTKHTCASTCLRCHAGLLLESHDQLLLRGEGAQVHPVGPELGSSCHWGSLLAVVILHLVHGLLAPLLLGRFLLLRQTGFLVSRRHSRLPLRSSLPSYDLFTYKSLVEVNQAIKAW